MDEKELKKFTAEFWKIPLPSIKPELELDDKNLNNQDSLRFFEFISEIEKKFKVRVENINQIKTFNDLKNNAK